MSLKLKTSLDNCNTLSLIITNSTIHSTFLITSLSTLSLHTAHIINSSNGEQAASSISQTRTEALTAPPRLYHQNTVNWYGQCSCPRPWDVLEDKFWVLGLGLEGQVLGLGLEGQVLGLGLEGQVLDLGHEGQVLGLGLEDQVLVNNTGCGNAHLLGQTQQAKRPDRVKHWRMDVDRRQLDEHGCRWRQRWYSVVVGNNNKRSVWWLIVVKPIGDCHHTCQLYN